MQTVRGYHIAFPSDPVQTLFPNSFNLIYKDERTLRLLKGKEYHLIYKDERNLS